MSRIILDEFRRRWWVWIFICFLCFVLGLLSAIAKNFAYFALYLIAISTGLFPRELGFGRALLSLPLTARQIGRAFWILCVPIQALLLMLFGGLGILCHYSLITSPAGFLTIWSQLVILGGLGCGSAFWLFSGAPAKPQEQWQNRFWGKLYSFGFSIALIGGGYLLYKSTISDEMKFVIVCFFGLVFSVLGWFRAEGLIVDYAAYRKEIAVLYRPKVTFRPQTSYGGIPYLIINSFTRFLGILMLAIAFAVGMSVWNSHRFNWPDTLVTMQAIRIALFLLCLWPVFPVSVHQRFLRSLPLTSKELSAVILCLPTLPFLLLCGIFVPIDIQESGMPAALSWLKAELLCLAPLCVLIAAIVQRDESRIEKIVSVLIVFSLSAIPATIQLVYGNWDPGKRDLPAWVIIAVPVISYSLAFFAIRNLLERNDMTYRVQVSPWTNVNSPNW